MSSVDEIEEAVKDLSEADYVKFRDWFAEFEASQWDARIENDIAEGKLDQLADKAVAINRSGAAKAL